MKVFDALARLDETCCVALRATRGKLSRLYLKDDLPREGLIVAPIFFQAGTRWEVAFVCEECSGNGTVVKLPIGSQSVNDPNGKEIVCPECSGEKMIWEGA